MTKEIKEISVEEAKPKRTRKPSGPSLEQRIEKLEQDNRALKEMLHKMKSAIGLPSSILPNLD